MGRQNFGAWLRQMRLARGMSLTELAIQIDISPSYLSDIELSRRDAPSDDVLDFLGVFLNIDRDVIFFRAGRLTPDVREMMTPDDVIIDVFAIIRRANPL